MDSRSDNLPVWERLALGGLLLGCAWLTPGCSRSLEPAPADSGTPVAGHAPRVVSLAPSLTEIICAIGAETQLVGRTSACDYPPDKISRIPVVGGFGAPSLDLLLKIRPTLVLDVDLQDAAVGKKIEDIGLKRERITCSTVDDIPRAIARIGRLLNAESSAGPLADSIHGRLNDLRREKKSREASGGPVPSVFVEIWSDPLTTVGQRSFISDLVSLAGGHNLGDEVTDRDYFPVSSEWVISRDPDVILCLYMAQNNPAKNKAPAARDPGPAKPDKPDGSGPAWNRVAARAGWAGMAAVKNQRVYGDLDNSAILRPGPRVLDGIETLRRRIEPKDLP